MRGLGAIKRAAAVMAAAQGINNANANIWPGMTQETAKEFVRIGRGMPISQPNIFAQLHVRYYHQQAYNTSGVTQLTYFNVPASEHVCNLGNGLAADERPFWLTGMTITAQDLTSAGAADGSSIDAAAVTPGTRLESWRKILSAGLAQVYVADRLIHEGQDLTKYPTGGGIDSAVTFNTTTAAGALWNNGIPHAGNTFRFPRPYPVLPGKNVRVLLKWQSLLAIAANAGRIKVELIGESVAPLNQ